MSPKANQSEENFEAKDAVKMDRSTYGREIIRDPVFAFWDKPFGLEQHIWNRIWLAYTHAFAFWYTYQMIIGNAPASTFIFAFFFNYIGALGLTVGCHRYWTHQSFKTVKPVQVVLMVLSVIMIQYPIFKWVLDHRIHHKYTDTNSDPHNTKNGFWFSHMGWTLRPKHPDLQHKLKTFPMDDLEKDPIVRFQAKYYIPLALVFHLALPTFIVWYFWELPLIYCLGSTHQGYVFGFNSTNSINSFAHSFGYRPYDKSISAVDNPVMYILAAGDGFHNFHHTFPWDYKTSEFGWRYNLSSMIIDVLAYFGLVWDMKTVNPKVVEARKKRTGDGSYDKNPAEIKAFSEDSPESSSWGWGDETIPKEIRELTTVLLPEGDKQKEK